MKIERKFDLVIETKRRFVIRQLGSEKQIACAVCGEPMLTAEQAAVFFKIKQRRIFQIIEAGAAHFAEIEAGAMMICLSSLATVLDDETQINKTLPPKM